MNKFDELTKGMAESVARRAALRKFGVGLTGMALACFGLAHKAASQTTCLPNGYGCTNDKDCCSGNCQTYFVPGWGKKQRYKVQMCAA